MDIQQGAEGVTEMLPEMSDALPVCPVETTLTLISDKWKVQIGRAHV